MAARSGRPGRRRGLRAFPARTTVAVAAGGLFGGPARYALDRALPASYDHIAWATFAANTVGSFMLGMLMAFVLELWSPRRYARALVCIGFVGSFTTFGTLAVDSDRLIAAGRLWPGLANLAANLAAGVAAVVLGLFAGRAVEAWRMRVREEGP